jgi:SAM-dependent methyltransferase
METPAFSETDVIRTISAHDNMNRDDPTFPEQYWVAGQSALRAIRAGLDSAQKPVSDVRRVLDLPCGYGRVLRYLKAASPHAEITACDVLKEAVDFCSSMFGAVPVYSHEDPSKIPLERNVYDLIWVGSLFTHLNSDRWDALLARLASSLRDGGVLIFTTHGHFAYRRMKGLEDRYDFWLPYWRTTKVLYKYERSGFGYGDYLEANGYGVSLSAPRWVIATLAKCSELRCVSYSECAWHGVQDVYACVKSTQLMASDTATPLEQYLKHVVREVWKPGR